MKHNFTYVLPTPTYLQNIKHQHSFNLKRKSCHCSAEERWCSEDESQLCREWPWCVQTCFPLLQKLKGGVGLVLKKGEWITEFSY